jgi:hypothetical protein
MSWRLASAAGAATEEESQNQCNHVAISELRRSGGRRRGVGGAYDSFRRSGRAPGHTRGHVRWARCVANDGEV